MIALKLIYIANIFVAGSISFQALFFTKTGGRAVFNNTTQDDSMIKLVGGFWLAITVLSILGLWRPVNFSPVLILQFIYKGTWLLVVALPAYKSNTPFASSMAVFFIVWVAILPFVIPWKTLLH